MVFLNTGRAQGGREVVSRQEGSLELAAGCVCNFRSLKQKDLKFKACVGYIVRACLPKPNYDNKGEKEIENN